MHSAKANLAAGCEAYFDGYMDQLLEVAAGDELLALTVDEGPRRRLSFGAELERREGLTTTASWLNRNLAGGGERLLAEMDADLEAVAEQLEVMRAEVLEYRDHPAVLAWVIGNELNHSYTNPRVYDAVNDVAAMIEELDPNHPTTTATSGFKPEVNAEILSRAPALDFISFQNYGSLFRLPESLAESGFDKPFMVTEWGAIGHWEVPKTSWGAPIEQNSSDKAANYLKSYQVAIESDERYLIGSYVFLWGQKQERTPTWYGMFLEDGSGTEAVDVMEYVWTGSWPENRSPQIRSMTLDAREALQSVVLDAAATYEARVESLDPDGDALTYKWEVMPESDATQTGGDREEIPPVISGLITEKGPGLVVLTTPEERGA